jgi:EgtB-related family protein
LKALWQQRAEHHDKLYKQPTNLNQSRSNEKTAHVPSQVWKLGSQVSNFDVNHPARDISANSSVNENAFCFDNELTEKSCTIQAFEIASQPVNWSQYLEFTNATGYRLPNYIRKTSTGFETEVFGNWLPLNKHAPAVHLSWCDAQAYCAWAQCRLPTEAEWDCAAKTIKDFQWGDVWEWTQDTFDPYEGFVAHPYTEYSEPWFGTHKVLRGASHATHPFLRHVNYRNFFTPERDDIYSGFRTCAL